MEGDENGSSVSEKKDPILDAILKLTEKIDKMSIKQNDMVSKNDLENELKINFKDFS